MALFWVVSVGCVIHCSCIVIHMDKVGGECPVPIQTEFRTQMEKNVKDNHGSFKCVEKYNGGMNNAGVYLFTHECAQTCILATTSGYILKVCKDTKEKKEECLVEVDAHKIITQGMNEYLSRRPDTATPIVNFVAGDENHIVMTPTLGQSWNNFRKFSTVETFDRDKKQNIMNAYCSAFRTFWFATGLCHGDINGENEFIIENGNDYRIQFIDYGFSKAIGAGWIDGKDMSDVPENNGFRFLRKDLFFASTRFRDLEFGDASFRMLGDWTENDQMYKDAQSCVSPTDKEQSLTQTQIKEFQTLLAEEIKKKTFSSASKSKSEKAQKEYNDKIGNLQKTLVPPKKGDPVHCILVAASKELESLGCPPYDP